MAVTSVANGQVNIAATSSEYTIGSAQTAAGVYVLVMDLNGMANGDIVVLRAYTKCRSSSTARLAFQATFGHVQVEKNKYSQPIPIDNEITFKVEQTAGSAIGNTDYTILRM